MSDMKTEIEQRINNMSEDMREHLKEVVYRLVRCYEEGTDEHALVVLGGGDGTGDIVSINCDTMKSANLLQSVSAILETINISDAPPKEMFN